MQDGTDVIDDENQGAASCTEENNNVSSEDAVCIKTNHSETLQQIWKFSFTGTEDFTIVPFTLFTNVMKEKTQNWEFLSFAEAHKSIFFILNDSTIENFLQNWKYIHFPNKIRVHISVCKQERVLKGIIFDRSIKLYETDELLEELSKQGVKNIRKIEKSTKDNRKKYFTGSLICEFKEKIPNQVILHGVTLIVEEFISRPMICGKCVLIGHKSKWCQSTEEDPCKICFKQHDPSIFCVVQCENCGQPHLTSDKNCPIFMREIEILKIKDNLNINYKGALEFLSLEQQLRSLRLSEKEYMKEIDILKEDRKLLEEKKDQLIDEKKRLDKQVDELEDTLKEVEKESEDRMSSLHNEIEDHMEYASAVNMQKLQYLQSKLSSEQNDFKEKIKKMKDQLTSIKNFRHKNNISKETQIQNK